MNIQRRYLHCICVIYLLLFSSFSVADVAVVVNVKNTSEFSNATLKKIFSAKTKRFPSGRSAVVIGRRTGSNIRKVFLKKLLNKSERQMKAYWSRLIFTGKALPPKEIDGDEEVKKLVNGNPSLIGYIDAESVDDSVRVIMLL